MLHGRLGTPWETSDQAADQHLTHWEQIDHGLQLTATRKFLTIVPIVLLVNLLLARHNAMQSFILLDKSFLI